MTNWVRQLKVNRVILLSIGTIGLGACLGITLGSVDWMRLPQISVQWPPGQGVDVYRPATVQNENGEIAFIYIGSSSCVWSNQPELIDIIGKLKLMLASRAEINGLGFAAVGIARDMVTSNGIAHLQKFGAFDEVMSGRGWSNIGVQKYIFDAIPGPAATPQILVVVRTPNDSDGAPGWASERLVMRKLGLREMTKWVSEGAPLPLAEAATLQGGGQA